MSAVIDFQIRVALMEQRAAIVAAFERAGMRQAADIARWTPYDPPGTGQEDDEESRD